MTTRVETIKIDYEPDGMVDDYTTITYELTGNKLITKTAFTEDWSGGATRTEQWNYEYDGAGNNILETHYETQWGGDEFRLVNVTERQFDASNKVAVETVKSPDFNENGILDDYITTTKYQYDKAGHMVLKREDTTIWGVQDPLDYREETWKYDNQGRLVETCVDDPVRFDCEIIRTYHYKHGVLQNIKEQNDIRYGDERPRIDESFTYNKDGTLKTKTDWADWSEYGWMQRVDTAYTWKPGYDSQKITYDREGDFKPEAVKFVENWYNSNGKLTHTLISHDSEGNGGPLQGGFDYRHLFVKTWDGDVMVAETRDYGIDGIIEYEFTSQLLVA